MIPQTLVAPRLAAAACKVPLAAARSFAVESGVVTASGGYPQQAPLIILEQLCQQTLRSAQQGAQKIGKAAHSGSPTPVGHEVRSFARSGANTLGQRAVPLLAAFVILARVPPGRRLTPEQQERVAALLPPGADEILRMLADAAPEDPRLTQLKRIADQVDTIEGKLDVLVAAAASAAASSTPTLGDQ